MFYSTRISLIISTVSAVLLLCGGAILTSGHFLHNTDDDIRSNALILLILIILSLTGSVIVLLRTAANRVSKPAGTRSGSGSVSSGEPRNLQPALPGPRSGQEKCGAGEMVSYHSQGTDISKLAGGVANEINNPLTGIFTFTEMLLKRRDLPPDVRSDLRTIAGEMERIGDVVKELLAYSSQTEPERVLTDVNEVAEVAISRTADMAGARGIRLILNRGGDLPLVLLDRTQITGVLLNIINNALDATQPGGFITVTTCARLSADMAGVEIICRDTGCGIAPENLEKIFDPFFTTKQVGHGAGLGLSASLGIITRHGGTVSAKSESGSGSAFTIWLPAGEQSQD